VTAGPGCWWRRRNAVLRPSTRPDSIWRRPPSASIERGWAYEEAIAAAVAAIGVTAVSRECEMSRSAVHAIVRRVGKPALRLPPANDGR